MSQPHQQKVSRSNLKHKKEYQVQLPWIKLNFPKPAPPRMREPKRIDIVELLMGAKVGGQPATELHILLHDAADEIERLRKALEYVIVEVDFMANEGDGCGPVATADMNEARLLAGMKKVETFPPE